jgi:hypothetical protein
VDQDVTQTQAFTKTGISLGGKPTKECVDKLINYKSESPYSQLIGLHTYCLFIYLFIYGSCNDAARNPSIGI